MKSVVTIGGLISRHKSLRALSHSHCGNLTVIPEFLGDLIHLRYLDLSITPVSKLPESTCSLHNLQILLLLNCAYLTELPQQMGRLTNLRCLDIRGTKLSEQLVVAVPPTIHELRLECCEKLSIQRPLPQLLNLTISNYNAVESLFEVKIDNKSSCIQKLSISNCAPSWQLPNNGITTTLKSLNVTNCDNIDFPMNQCYAYLERLCISCSCNSQKFFIMDMFPKMVHLEIRRCQNLESLVVSKEHVQCLQSIKSLKISECPHFVSFPEGGLAAPNLTNLQLEKCKSLNYLPCKMNKLLPSLLTLNIRECPELESFSEGGLPDSLNLLQIFHCAKLFTNRKNWNLQKLPSLRSFVVAGSCQDGESFPEKGMLPSTLTSLHIIALWNLKYLDEDNLQKLTSLETLGIACCPQLQRMPAKLPSTISTLYIMTSPRLEERCKGKKAEDWPKIAHIPVIRINKILLQ